MAKNITPLLWIGTILLSLLFVINFATAKPSNNTSPDGQVKIQPLKSSLAYTQVALNNPQRQIPYHGISGQNNTTPVKGSSAATDNILLLYSLLVSGFLILQRSAFSFSR